MKTISMPQEEYLKDLMKSEHEGYQMAFRVATTFLESGKTPLEWLESSNCRNATNNEKGFYAAMDDYLKDRDRDPE